MSDLQIIKGKLIDENETLKLENAGLKIDNERLRELKTPNQQVTMKDTYFISLGGPHREAIISIEKDKIKIKVPHLCLITADQALRVAQKIFYLAMKLKDEEFKVRAMLEFELENCDCLEAPEGHDVDECCCVDCCIARQENE